MPRIKANGIELEYVIDGEPDARPLLAIMGLGAQLIRWPQAFVDRLAARGFRVIRFDNRDVGLSEKLEAAGQPDFPAIMAARAAGQTPPVAYTLDDMAKDATGLLDVLGVAKAHIVGASMGGMIAQLVAADHPHKTLSLTSIFSTTGHPDLPPATPEAMARLTLTAPDPRTDLDAYVAHSIASSRVMGSPGYPATDEKLRAEAIATAERCYYPAGFARQYAAIVASGNRRERVRKITAPTTVIHGTDDPLVPVTGGRDTAANIPGAVWVEFPGMGHDIPVELYDPIIDAIAANADRVVTA
jgi:pimeloyl-ACP methyl ester carboxylesterase